MSAKNTYSQLPTLRSCTYIASSRKAWPSPSGRSPLLLAIGETTHDQVLDSKAAPSASAKLGERQGCDSCRRIEQVESFLLGEF